VETQQTQFVAVVSSRDSQVIHVDSEGAVVKLFVHDGQYVHKGDLIAQLDVSVLRANLEKAKGQLSHAKGEAGRAYAIELQAQRKAKLAARLMRSGVDSPEELAAAQTDARSNGAEAGAAEGDIEAATAAIKEDERLIDAANVKSPMDGIISTIKLHEGEVAHQGMTLARVFDPTDLQVRFLLPRNQQAVVGSGSHVEFDYEGGRKLSAVVSQVIDGHDPAIDFLQVVAELDQIANRPADVQVGIRGYVRTADKGVGR